MNEIAKALWDTSNEYLNAAQENTDVNISICYVSIGELALKSAQFAVDNPLLVAGIDEFAPPGPQPNSPVPQQPSQGPKFWGAPT